MLNRAFGIATDVAGGRFSPRYDVDEDEDKFQVSMDVPGVPGPALDIRIEGDDVLVIEGERSVGRAADGARSQKFSKRFSLGETADIDAVSAQLSNGVLVVTVPKVPKSGPAVRKVPVMQVTTTGDADASAAPPAAASGSPETSDEGESGSIPIARNDDADEPEAPADA